MCGRFLLEPRTPQTVRAFFDLEEDAPATWMPRWNVAPTQAAPVVRRGAQGRSELVLLRWGLVPAWSQAAAATAPLINARSETAAVKPSFRAAWKARRCVIPATGWYEWRREGDRKQPWLLRLSGSEFTAFAGLWERWHPEGAEALESFTILTAPAIPALADLHERMPVVLAREEIAAWLAPGAAVRLPAPERLAALAWECFPVSSRVNQARHDDESCARPLTDGERAC